MDLLFSTSAMKIVSAAIRLDGMNQPPLRQVPSGYKLHCGGFRFAVLLVIAEALTYIFLRTLRAEAYVRGLRNVGAKRCR
jgi:hypothetical protein